ncbi:MAG: hypothetical protein K5697_15405 [Lachnospiraceae bacterium]|nr:hypothetical protein [Lachnospiraceae bacterium]
MKTLLGAEYGAFLSAFGAPAEKAFHVNLARIGTERMASWLSAENFPAMPFPGSSAWRFTDPEENTIGHKSFHHAGAVYSQDPAAMLVLSGVELNPELHILDLCAAPGGKTSQLAMAVDGGSGYVFANEPNPSRNRILVSNIERMGYRNVIVTCLSPEELATLYPAHFDLVLVDAPCSGEGMFRKYPESVSEWSEEAVLNCARRQRDILNSAAVCLRPGGRLIYSTCTWAVEEDEAQLEYLTSQLHFSPLPLPAPVAALAYPTAPGAARCYPHRYAGEGQFMAYLQKEGEHSLNSRPSAFCEGLRDLTEKEHNELRDCLGDEAGRFLFYSYRDRIILFPGDIPRLPARNVSCVGVTVAEKDTVKKRLIPHHQFFSAYGSELLHRIDCEPGDPRIAQYLCGLELPAEGSDRHLASFLCCSVPIGGLRAAGGRYKNLYPKGLREH